jgi:F0F1-type ATP synthase assembly protein I
MSSDKDKLEELSQRIRNAEAKREPKLTPFLRNSPGYDFAGTLFGSIVLGLFLDHVFDTGTWCVIGSVGFGFVVGVYGLWKSANRPANKE